VSLSACATCEDFPLAPKARQTRAERGPSGRHFTPKRRGEPDFSARDTQQHEMRGRLGPAKGKDFDTGNAIGPWLVTPDEIPDPYNLTMTARVDGEEWSRGNSGETSYRFDELIAYMSRSETLYPGDFIGSGTCSGRLGKGCGLEQGRFLTAGNIVELEVEHIGVLRNRVISSTSRGRPGPNSAP
jgi:2-keto-4-pentenoate hydratase/2-oxohepta-3-ene-1,7-dioic acid hydratase in catechol pathway